MIQFLSSLQPTTFPIFLRTDLNVPLKNAEIIDATRIEKIIPTVNALLQKTNTIVICTHLGRPKAEDNDPGLSTKLLAKSISEYINLSVHFIENMNNYGDQIKKPGIYLLENVRFYEGELRNDEAFAQKLLGPCKIYVNDAFSCSHRAHASIDAITRFAPAYGGLLLEDEIKNIDYVMNQPLKPLTAIIGGSKVSTKIDILKNIIQKVDHLIIGGAMANTFLKAQNLPVGSSLYEPTFLDFCRDLLDNDIYQKIILPIDFKVGLNLNDTQPVIKKRGENFDGMILDFGPESLQKIKESITQSKTILWNGPLGAYEYSPYHLCSVELAHIITQRTEKRNLYSLVGGGDTAAVLNQNNLLTNVSYASTAGGAFLEFFEGKELPGLKALNFYN
jgi:phosphoglycerate kinase